MWSEAPPGLGTVAFGAGTTSRRPESEPMSLQLFRRSDRKLDLLSDVPLFAGLDRSDLARVARLVDIVDVEAGRTLIHQGSLRREFFVLVDGQVVVEVDDVPVACLGPGDFFGELAILDMGARTATVRTATEGQVLVVSAQAFRTLMSDEPLVASRVLTAVATRVRDLEASRPAA